MLLIHKDGKYVAYFRVVGEVQDLTEREEGWVPLYLLQGTEPIGEIQSRTHEVHIFDVAAIQDRQVVFLGKNDAPARSRVPDDGNEESTKK